jgi:dolichyl-phosphate beta-glucosyltransferase
MTNINGTMVEVRQVVGATAHRAVLPECAQITSSSGQKPDLPAAVVRASCDLEILIPSLNEAERLPCTLMRTIEYLEAQPYSSSVVVIDNDSVDQTSDVVARKWSDRVSVVLTGCAQPGKGAAVRRGLLTSRARFVGYMDADLATPIETLDIVMPLLENFPVVVGSRWMRGAAFAKRQPAHRIVSGMMFRMMANRVLPGITDTQCGFKFFAGDLARMVARGLRIDGFAFDVELLRAILDIGVPIKEIPVVWSNGEGSTLHAVRDGKRAAVDVFRLARGRLA